MCKLLLISTILALHRVTRSIIFQTINFFILPFETITWLRMGVAPLSDLWIKGRKKTNRKSRQSRDINSVKENWCKTEKRNSISVTDSPTLPNIREIINKHWHRLNINNTFGNVFKVTPVITFCKNTLCKYNQTQQKTSEG